MKVDDLPPMGVPRDLPKPKRKMSLAEKIFRIQHEVPKIERNGVGYDGDRAFSYAKAEDVFAAVHPLLKKYRLLITGRVSKEAPIVNVLKGGALSSEVMVDWIIKDMSLTREEQQDCIIRNTWPLFLVECKIPGAAVGEQGLAKALTASRKAFYIMTFNLQIADEEIADRPPQPKDKTGAKERPDSDGAS